MKSSLRSSGAKEVSAISRRATTGFLSLSRSTVIGAPAAIVATTAKVGGGALPLLELDGPAVALPTDRDPAELIAALRDADPPVIARIHDGTVLLDPRTLAEEEIEPAAAAARAALAQWARDQ